MMKYENFKKNKGPVPYEAKGLRSGFVILFAVTISAILLAIALGVANIALKEIKFGTNARDTNDAFFAADVGAECALLYDYSKSAVDSAFGGVPSVLSIACLGGSVTINSASSPWNFRVSRLGSTGQGCAYVTVTKSGTPLVTTINSKGYNIGGSAQNTCDHGSNAVERELQVSY